MAGPHDVVGAAGSWVIPLRPIGLFTRLQGELGFAVLFISHALAVVEQVAHRVVVLHRGRIVEAGATAEILGSPRDG